MPGLGRSKIVIPNTSKGGLQNGLLPLSWKYLFTMVFHQNTSNTLSHRNRQGNEQMRTFEPTNESADCGSAAQSYNFIIRVK